MGIGLKFRAIICGGSREMADSSIDKKVGVDMANAAVITESGFQEQLMGGDDDINIDGEEEEILASAVGTAEENKFDEIVGKIEEILMDPEFVSLQKGFCLDHCDVFEDMEENKLEYMDLFNQYQTSLEAFIEKRLGEQMEGFTMDSFFEMINSRPDELDSTVFDMLLSLSDFGEFKGLMLSHKRKQDGESKSDMMQVVGDHVDG